MTENSRWILNKSEKAKFISVLSNELLALRAKAQISQDELANLVGISRQTYGSIERGVRKMTWNTYLSLILFYDYNDITHDFIRRIGAFPDSIVIQFNKTEER